MTPENIYLSMSLKNADVGWLVVLRPIDSEVIKRRHPHLLSLAKDGSHRESNPWAVAWNCTTAAYVLVSI